MSESSGLISAWLSAPEESSTAFRETFSLVSRAIQLALREYLPERYFADLYRYRDRERAFPLLAYQCSRPAPLDRGREYTYDLLNPEMMSSLMSSFRQRLPKHLARMEAAGLFAGDIGLARMYAPWRYLSIVQFVRRRRRLLDRILATETRLVNALVLFSVALPRARSAERLHERLVASWRGSLARIYADLDASPFLEELLGVATRALIQSQNGQSQRIPGEFPDEAPTTSA